MNALKKENNMKSTKLFLALASSILLASCNLGAESTKELTFAEAKEVASEIIKTTKDEKFVFPTKLTGDLKMKHGVEEASLKFITDSEKQCFYTKIDSKELNDDSQIVSGSLEEWAYKEGDSFINALSATAEGKTEKYYYTTERWVADYTAESFVSISSEVLDAITGATTEKEFFDETEGMISSATYKSTGKGNLIIEATGKDASMKLVIKDNLLADLEAKQDDMVETYHVTYGKAEFTKPDLTKFEKYDFE